MPLIDIFKTKRKKRKTHFIKNGKKRKNKMCYSKNTKEKIVETKKRKNIFLRRTMNNIF